MTQPDLPPPFYPDFKPGSDHLVTVLLIGGNILVFILMVVSGVNAFEPDSANILAWGGNYAPRIIDGEWWRLITSCFVHIGILHLLLNLYALFAAGLMLEPFIGKIKFAAAYLLTGILSGLTCIWWNDSALFAGASGAIFGIYGVFLALLTTNTLKIPDKKPLLISLAVFIIVNLLYGIQGNVANSAHIGGLCGGIAIGYAFYPALKEPGNRQTQVLSIIIPSLTILLLTLAVIHHLPR